MPGHTVTITLPYYLLSLNCLTRVSRVRLIKINVDLVDDVLFLPSRHDPSFDIAQSILFIHLLRTIKSLISTLESPSTMVETTYWVTQTVTPTVWVYSTPLSSAASSNIASLEALMANFTWLFISLVALSFLLASFVPDFGAQRRRNPEAEEVHLRGGAAAVQTDTPAEEEQEEVHNMTEAPIMVPDAEDETKAVAVAENRKRRISSHIDETLRQRRRMPATFDGSDDEEFRYRLDADEEESDHDDDQTPENVDSEPDPKRTDGPTATSPSRKEAIEATVSQIMAKRAEQGKISLPASQILLSRQHSESGSDFALPPPAMQDNSSSEEEPLRTRAQESSISNHINAMMQQQSVEQTNWSVGDVPFDSQQGTHKGYRYSDSKNRGLLARETSSESDSEAPSVVQLNFSLPGLPSRSPLTGPPPSTQEKAYTNDEFNDPNRPASQSLAAAQRYHASIDEAWAQVQAQAQTQPQLPPQSEDVDSSDEWIHAQAAPQSDLDNECVCPSPSHRGQLTKTKTVSELLEANIRRNEHLETTRTARSAPTSRPISPTIIEFIHQQRTQRARAHHSQSQSQSQSHPTSRTSSSPHPPPPPASNIHSLRHAGWALGSRLLFASDPVFTPVFAPLSAFSPSVDGQVNDRLDARRQLDETRPARRPPIELDVGTGSTFFAQYASHTGMRRARRRQT
jgi:hypothetical protein